MRRALVIAVAVPVLALSACSSDAEPNPSDPAAETTATQSPDDADTTSDTATTTATSAPDDESETTGDAAEADATGDKAEATGGPDDDVEGGADGQAAADVTKEFITAIANADPDMCTLMADLQGEGTGPLKDDKELLDICKKTIPGQAKGEITDEQAAILGVMEISGADVQGDTAKVDKDNFSDLFAAGFGDQTFVLKKYDDDWYIDLGLSQLSPPDEG